MTERREARELVVMYLHQWDLQRDDAQKDELLESFLSEQASGAKVSDYARRILRLFWEHEAELDGRLEAAAENWRLDRMAVVDRNVLRLAVTEILYCPDVPPKVSIDEAIELAKKYSTEKSGAFVNGVLDRILGETDDQESSHGAR